MRIQHNIMAMSAYRNYTNNVSAMKKNLEKLSSGYKINRAGDDAAGLAISEKMRAQITGLETAQKNAKDGISLVQTAEGALTEVHDMLNRMVELATMSANGTYDDTTDRAQLQKELEQLTSEINRIADSSNFNGIKLLDGSLGMNTEGFKLGSVTAATAATGATNASNLLTFAGASAAGTAYHGVAGATTQEPAFSVNLGDLEIATGVTLTFKIGDKSFALAASTKAMDTDAIGAALVTKINKEVAAGSLGWSVGTSSMIVKASYAGDGKITFEYQGIGAAAATKVDTDTDFTAAQAEKFNKLFGGDFSVTADKASKVTGDIDHEIYEAQSAVSGASVRAGIDVTINKDLIKDGSTLTIGSKTFEFKVSKDHKAATGNTAIDVSDLAATGATSAALLKEAVLKLSNESATGKVGSKSVEFEIHTKDAASGKIHLEQTVTNYASGSNSINPADIKELVSASQAGSPAAAAKVELTVDVSKLTAGNVLSIDDNKFEYKKDFNTVDELKDLISAKGYGVELSTNTLTISAAKVTDGAPVVLGKGLTLQIGDTAESFNQLNVSVKDCHANSLGVETDATNKQISITTAESAQDAIQKIKDAINYVSDVRGTLGATQNRLDHTINNLSVMTENIQDAESTIRDVDVAEEMMAYTKNNILIQSAQAMLAQANQVPQGVLQLLQ